MGVRLTGTLAVAALALAAASSNAAAQGAPPPYGTQPQYAAPAANQACVRRESQLAMIDRPATDPARAEQIRRAEDAARQQQAELDRLQAVARRNGCESSGFFLFGGQSPQCADINGQIQRARGNLDRWNNELARLQGNTGDRSAQRRAVWNNRQAAVEGNAGGRSDQLRPVVMALAQNDVRPKCRTGAPPRPQNFF